MYYNVFKAKFRKGYRELKQDLKYKRGTKSPNILTLPSAAC